jgi:hypothetical protein
MSRLARYTQLLFGTGAGTNQMAEFGSKQNGTPARYSGSTITPSIVQGLANYLDGWFAAIIGVSSPTIEDMNALCFLFAYQLAYIMQEGIPEYDSGTTYFTGSLCSSGGQIYVSLVDNNIGNALLAFNFWAIYDGRQTGYSSDQTLNASEEIVFSSSSGGNVTITLAPLASVPRGKRYTIKDVGNGSFTTSLKGSGSDPIDGNNIYASTLGQNDSVTVIAAVTNWYVI